MTNRAAQAVANRSALANLPFVGKIENTVVSWLVGPSGDWIADCELGDRCARLIMRLSGRTTLPYLLGCVDMIATGRFNRDPVRFHGSDRQQLS